MDRPVATDSPAKIAQAAGFQLSTVDVHAFEVCFDLYGEDWLLATVVYDGKPANAFIDNPTRGDDPVGWCIQFSDELVRGELALWQFECPQDRIDLAAAMACGMVQQRLHQKNWWQPLPGHRIWDKEFTAEVKAHHRFEIDPAPQPATSVRKPTADATDAV